MQYVLHDHVWSNIVLTVGAAAPGNATTHYVARNGTNSASCTATAPCATFFQALTNAAPNDTIVCVDSFASGTILINKSIDIDCSTARHFVRDNAIGSPGAAIFINIFVSDSDPFKTVRLRGISILGASTDFRRVPRGIDIVSANVVQIEDVVVSDVAQQGILDRRSGGQTKLFITDSIIRNNAGAGIVAAAGATGTAVLDNVRSENNAYGIAVATGNNVSISRSVFSGNSTAGIEGDPGAQVVVDHSTITHNNIGVQSSSSVRLSNNNIAFNNSAISGVSGTFGNNRLSGNVSVGTISTPLGSASGEFAQQ